MHRRITLVNTVDQAADPSRPWCLDGDAPSRVVFASFLAVIHHTFDGHDQRAEEDIERIILDRTATADEFLELMAHVSDDFAGDVLFIREGDTAYVSTAGRGAGRLLYALRAADLRFYLETHGLIARPSVAAA